MSVASVLGVEDTEGSLMTAARRAWLLWVEADPALGVAADLVDLRRWLAASAPADRDVVMCKLAALAVTDNNAAVAMAWLLVPGSAGIAASLADAAPDIDGLVAGHLWIELRTGHGPVTYVARTILRNVKRAVMAELSIGDPGERADKTWAATTPRERVDVDPLGEGGATEMQHVLRVLLQHLMDVDDITIAEAQLLASAAGKADWLSKPMRGRAGLILSRCLGVPGVAAA